MNRNGGAMHTEKGPWNSDCRRNAKDSRKECAGKAKNFGIIIIIIIIQACNEIAFYT